MACRSVVCQGAPNGLLEVQSSEYKLEYRRLAYQEPGSV